MTGTKTFMARPGEVESRWYVVDATDKVVGRLAAQLAMMLMGKNRPTYTPHVECGDSVVIINCEKIKYTGKRKWQQRTHTWYTGYHGQRSVTAEKLRETHPERIIQAAVRRMLPKNKLASKMLDRLKVYAGPNHPHQAQQPELKTIIA